MVANEDLYVKVRRLQNLMLSRATGQPADEKAYVQLRREVMTSSVKGRLPHFVHMSHTLPEFWMNIKRRAPTYEERRTIIYDAFRDVLGELEFSNAAPSDSIVKAAVGGVTEAYIIDTWTKAVSRRVSDPEGAITAARSLLEVTCKHVLDKKGIPYKEGEELPTLYNAASKTLNLSPSQHTEQIFKQILGGCHSVVEGLGALRNKMSDAHGSTKARKVKPRHAELSVNLAGAMATFLLKTLEDK